MRILFAGDSWTYGDELENLNSRFTTLAANAFSAEEINIGKPAASNYNIHKNVIEQCRKETYDVIVIQWTYFTRFCYPYQNEIVEGNNTPAKYDSIYKLLLKTNTNDEIWMKWYAPFVFSLDGYCKSKGSKVIHIFMQVHEKESFERLYNPTEMNIMSHTLHHIADPRTTLKGGTKLFPWGQRFHPLEEGHKQIAEKVFIPNMKNFLNIV